MDKVKAIKVLKPLVDSYVDYANISMKEEDDNIVEALEMAIEALKALDVPDTNVGDMISRQMAIDTIMGQPPEPHYPSWYAAQIEKLPAAQPEQVCIATVTLTDEQVKEVAEKAKNAVISVIESEPHWIPCSERLPSETVIATVETKTFKYRYVCEAVWIPRWTRKVLFDEWEDCSEYKEEDDEYYVIEGWYERVHNWDEYAYVAIDDNVIAWMPIPIPYCGGNEE